MGTFGLELIDKSGFDKWLQTLGYTSEYDFWSSLSSLSEGTSVDHMIDYLTALGYTGTPADQFRKFLEGQVGNIGTLYDMANKLSQSGILSGVILAEDGDFLLGEDGTPIFEE